ncbi:Aminoglycoside phosphotransferase [Sulfitobacter noctilucae]|uniref:aminoglycoside phosphotransferase family protein n=1 Tax=Sulfitobacter noctilucae TaxID=1342302 RepID=UPI00046A0DB8|nr:phosphotransferase [Sulfitobacter noctilucae]KIN65766.1 Aminoglycoside phosphotransferase [Sulfitobacter noctilucae]
MTDRADQSTAFLTAIGWQDARRSVVAGDASNRRYDRLIKADGAAAILMDAPPDKGEDTGPFVSISRHLCDIGLKAPEIYNQDSEHGFLLIEDFGDDLFADLMANDPGVEIPLYRAATDVLIHLHQHPAPPLPSSDAQYLTTMVAPLFDWYAPNPDGMDAFAEQFYPLAQRVANADQVMILRDYHAQNLMLLDQNGGLARVGILDFQDAMLGHPAYDLVSILQDARRDVSPEIEAEILAYMLDRIDTEATEFRACYAILGLQRNLRILGIFARLCLRDGKAHYVDLIPRVWGYVQRNLAHPDLLPLSKLLDRLLPDPSSPFLESLKQRCPPSPS